MSQFDDRRDAFEKRFAHDEALRFKIDARANRMLGAWAAEKLKLQGEESAKYVTSVIRADFEEAGREDVFRKIAADLSGIAGDEEIREQMEITLDQAKQQILAES